MCGSNIGVFDTDIICTLDRLCDDMGMDTIDIGCALGVMMDQGVLAFGDGEGAIDLVRNMFALNSRWGNVLRMAVPPLRTPWGYRNSRVGNGCPYPNARRLQPMIPG